MTYYNANDIVDKLFKSLFWKYQSNLETLIRGSDLFLIQSKFCISNATE